MIIYAITILTYILSILFASVADFRYRFLAFSLHILSVFLVPVSLLVGRNVIRKIVSFISKIKTTEALAIGILVVYVSLLYSYKVQTYPFAAGGDEVRDGGLQAMEIVNGSLVNIFGYGSYDAHGLIIPTITSFFYRVYGASVLTFRIPAMIVGYLGIVTLYILVRKLSGFETAFWSSFVLASLPLHLFYSRTEIVVIFSSTLTVIILLAFYLFYRRKTIITAAVLSLLLGFAANFHTSVRVVSIITLFLAFSICIYWWIKDCVITKKINGAKLALPLILLFFFVIGFGPRVLYTSGEVFFQTRSFRLADAQEQNQQWSVVQIINSLKQRYTDSLLSYISKPTTSFDSTPILPFLLSLFFITGVVVTFLEKKNTEILFIASYVVILPFTNSAMTDTLNIDHRFAPLFPLAAIMTGLGIKSVLTRLRSFKVLQLGIAAVLFLYIAYQGIAFFINQSANRDKPLSQYLTAHLVYFLRDEYGKTTDEICIYAHPMFTEHLETIHIREQFSYFIPSISYKAYAMDDGQIPENTLYLSAKCEGIGNNWQRKVISCESDSYFCPVTETGFNSMIIYYEVN